MNTVKCSNRLCEKEYNVQFDKCPFCGTSNPIEEGERRALIEKENNDTESKPEATNGEKFSGWVIGIIWLNILFGGIRGIINSVTVVIYSPVWGAVDLGLQIIGIISLGFLLLAKKWALYLWVGYLIAVSIINGHLSNNDYFTLAIVAAVKLVLMLLFLQIRKDGVSAWSFIFNKKKVDVTNNDINDSHVAEELIEKELITAKNGNNSDTVKIGSEEKLAVETLDKKDVAPTTDDKEIAQTEEPAANLQKETASEKSDCIQADAKNGRNKNKHTSIKIGKWWIFSLIVVAILAIVWLVVWISHRPKELELGKYVYVDKYSILHINRNCDKIAVFHGASPVKMYTLREIESGKWDQVCSGCVSDIAYEAISHFIVGNDNTRLLYTTLVEDNYDMPDYEQFLIDIQDTIKQKKLHANMGKDGYMLPNFEVFVANLGLVTGQKPSKNGNYEKNNARMLWDELSKEYNDVGTFEEFSAYIMDESNRRKLYHALKKHGYEISDFGYFTRYLMDNEK